MRRTSASFLVLLARAAIPRLFTTEVIDRLGREIRQWRQKVRDPAGLPSGAAPR